MAGNKVVVVSQDLGYTVMEILENVEPDDEWALFRLTDQGLAACKIGPEIEAGIMSLSINGKRAVQEISRHRTKAEAKEAKNKLSKEEQERTIIRAVRPK